MRIALVTLVSLLALGCATEKSKAPATPDRSTASTQSSMGLNIQANEIKEVAILANSASTVCSATGKDRTDLSNVYYSCVTTAKVGVRVVSPYLHIDQVYKGDDNYVITGYGSRNGLADPSPDAGTAKELANLQANNLAALGRRYHKLSEGCMGDSVVLTYGADKIDLQTGAYFGDLMCKIRRKNAKIAAGTVYYLDMAKGDLQGKVAASGANLMAGVQVLVEADQKNSETIGWMATQAKERTTDAAQKYADTVKKVGTQTADQVNDAAQKSSAAINKMAGQMKDYVAAMMNTVDQAKNQTRQASADALKNLSDSIRP